MDPRLYDFLHWVISTISSAWKYVFGSSKPDNLDGPETVAEGADGDSRADDNRGNSTVANHENNNVSTNSQGAGPVFNVNISSNHGTVVISDQSTITSSQSSDQPSLEQERNEQTLSLATSQLNDQNNEPLSVTPRTVYSQERTQTRRRRRPREVNTSSSKVPASVRRVNEVEMLLKQLRENGNWDDHEDSLESLRREYERDEHNSGILLLLKYEEAAKAYMKNEIDKAYKIVNKLAEELKIKKRSDRKHLSENLEMIACKCLFLTSKIYCVKNSLGKAEKALDVASEILSDHKSIALQAQLFLAYAHHQFHLNTTKCTLKRAQLVIDHTNRAESVSNKLKDQKRSRFQELRRQILLLRSKAILQLYCDGGEKVFEDLLSKSLAELEGDMWDGISELKKVQFDILKSHYFLSCGNASSALDWARRAREIAEECGFTKELISLNDHIQMRVPTIFTDGRCDGVNLLNIAREIETTTDGHAESAASEVTDFALFSDDSEWDNSGYDGHFLQIEDESEMSD